MITIILPFPDMRLSTNQTKGKHWTAINRLVKPSREVGFWSAKEQVVTPLPFTKIKVTHNFYPPDKRNRDDDNILSAHKRQRDGVADAIGIDDKHWTNTYKFHDPVKNGKVVLEIEGTK